MKSFLITACGVNIKLEISSVGDHENYLRHPFTDPDSVKNDIINMYAQERYAKQLPSTNDQSIVLSVNNHGPKKTCIGIGRMKCFPM